MKLKTVDSLLMPIHSGIVSMADGARGVFLNAVMDGGLVPLRSQLTCVQTRRPEFLTLQSAGMSVSDVAPAEGKADFVLCALPKNKAQAQADMALGLSLLKPGGWLICAGRNDSGAASLAKTAQKLGPLMQQSKYHHRIFWMRRTDGALPEVCSEWMNAGALRAVKAIDAVSSPAVFGWNKVDKGSELLASQFDDRIAGHVLDLGSGWGYLSRELLARSPKVNKLTLVEAEAVAVEASRQNLAPVSGACEVQCLWQDVTAEPLPRLADCVVMNPPFHSGKDTDMELGFGFVRAARKALRPGGRLLMVANRHLPYEKELSRLFKRYECIAETSAFKVICAYA